MKARRHVWQWIAAFLVLVASTGAWAQEGEGGDEGAGGPLADDLANFWSERRDVRVIEHRLYEKVGRHEFTLFGGIIPNDPFLDYYPVGLRYDYFLLESLALELDGSYIGDTFRSTSELEDFLARPSTEGGAGARVDLLDQQRWRAHFGVNWSPFYGKIAILGAKLLHFDLCLAAGFGIVNVRSLTSDRLTEEDEYKPEGSLGVGFNFFLNDMFSIRLDYRQFIFEKAGGGVSNPSEITLGFSVFL